MKYLNKFLLMSAVAVAGLFSACTDNDYEPGAPVDGMQIYFPNTIPSEYSVPDTESSVTIPVKRVNTDEAMQVSILANEESGLFTIPSTVSFQAGSASADLVITFDRSALVDGTEYPVSLLLTDQANTTPYGNYMVDFTIVPWPWKEIGKGKFRDDWFAPMWTNAGNPEIEVTMHQHKSKPGIYMVEEMFGWPYLTEFFGGTQEQVSQIVSYTPTNITIDCTDPNKVVIPRQFTGITDLDPSYGDYEIAMYENTYGTLEEGVITFPKECMAIVFGGGNALTSNESGLFRIVLPGFEATDYSLTAAYGGMRIGADNESANLILDFTYGADVTGINFVVAQGDQTASAADIAAKIIDGTADNINLLEDFQVGGEKVSVETPLADAGVYTVVAVAADKNQTLLAKTATAASFYYPGLGGAEVPECDLQLSLGLPSEFLPAEDLEKYPDISSLCFMLEGSELKTLSAALLSTRVVESALAEGQTNEDLLAMYGDDYSELMVPEINAEGGYVNVWTNLADGSSYTMIVKASNIYGKSIVLSVAASTKLVTYPDYKGDLAIGKYVMTYDAPLQGGGTMTLNNYFRIIPNNNSSTEFFVRDIALELGIDWYADYNASSNELVLDGTWKGNEESGSYLGGWVAFSSTQAYLFASYSSDPETQGADPIILGIDPTTKQPATLKSDIEVYSGTIVGQQVQSPMLIAIYLADGTVFSVDSDVVSQSVAAMMVNSRHAQFVPFSSVGNVSRDSEFVSINRFAQPQSNMMPSHGLRTIKINATKCEPLPKQFGERAKFNKQDIRPLK